VTIVSPYLTFPPVQWWLLTADATTVILDKYEHYVKMSERNRYRVSGSNNSILLTVPMVNGRDQSTPMHSVDIFNEQRWQVQHWRTLHSVYNRSPYFFHYETSLRVLFETPFQSLIAFNLAALQWVMAQVGSGFALQESTDYIAHYDDGISDLRTAKISGIPVSPYYQVFEDRIGFVSGLSILDLLFAEGPHTGAWLRRNVIKG
jgi:hypothetical protein